MHTPGDDAAFLLGGAKWLALAILIVIAVPACGVLIFSATGLFRLGDRLPAGDAMYTVQVRNMATETLFVSLEGRSGERRAVSPGLSSTFYVAPSQGVRVEAYTRNGIRVYCREITRNEVVAGRSTSLDLQAGELRCESSLLSPAAAPQA